MDVIIILSSWRPEFLYLCLEAISKCDLTDKEIWIVQDHKQGDDAFPQAIEDTQEVIKIWKNLLGDKITPILRPLNGFYGGTYNFLSALNRAYKTDCRYVYEIEEDIIVTEDFFNWHEAIQADGNFFCSIGCQFDLDHDGNQIAPAYRNIENGYFKYPYCRTVGICFKRENLAGILEHYIPDYYTSEQTMVDYLWEKFPNFKYGYSLIEYDGLISRIMEKNNYIAAVACAPRARHVGIWGYHRSIGLKAMEEAGLIHDTLMNRIEILEEKLNDPEWLKSVADFQIDIHPPLKINPVTEKVFCIN